MPDTDDTATDSDAEPNAPDPKAGDGGKTDSRQVLADLNAASDAASAEYSRVMARQHTEREALRHASP